MSLPRTIRWASGAKWPRTLRVELRLPPSGPRARPARQLHRCDAGAMEHWIGRAGLVGSVKGLPPRPAAGAVGSGQEYQQDAPVRSKRVIASPLRGSAGSCSKILPSAEPVCSGKYRRRPQRDVRKPAAVGSRASCHHRPKALRSFPSSPAAQSPAKTRKAVCSTATLPNRRER